MDDVTPRQRRILDFIKATVRDRGYPPTVREIGEAVGLNSSSSVHAQLANLERRGLLRRDPTKPRAMELQGAGVPTGRAVTVPVLGRISAGAPVLANEDAPTRGISSLAFSHDCKFLVAGSHLGKQTLRIWDDLFRQDFRHELPVGRRVR